MKALVPVVTLIVLAAGCVTPGDPATTASIGDALDRSTSALVHTASGALGSVLDVPLAVGAAFHTGAPASEPTLAIASDGTIFMTGQAPNPSCGLIPEGCPKVPLAGISNGATVLRSKDNGLTWEDVYVKLPSGDSLKVRSWDPYVYLDPATDRVFMDDIFPVGCGMLSFSDDLGDTWLHDPASCGNPHVNDHQTIVAAKPRVLPTAGYPNLIYRCVNNGAYAACAISVNGGLSFLPQIPVGPTMERACAAITGHLEADAEGRVYLGAPCGGNPGVMRTEDDGRTWTMSKISEELEMSQSEHDVDLAVDEAGNVYALFVSGNLPYFSASTDHGDTWSTPIMVGAPGVTFAKFNAIDAGAPGRVAFAYVGTTIPGADKLTEVECPSPVPGLAALATCTEPEDWASATWNAYVGVMADALAADPIIQTVTANDPADPLARGACGDRCHGMTDFIDIRIGSDGRPWASFVDVCIAECVTDPSVLFDGNSGLAATIRTGPTLRGELSQLVEIPLQTSGSA